MVKFSHSFPNLLFFFWLVIETPDPLLKDFSYSYLWLYSVLLVCPCMFDLV